MGNQGWTICSHQLQWFRKVKIRNIFLSLKVISFIYIIRLKETGNPNAVYLYMLGKIARCQPPSTNNLGEFYFVVRNPGTNEIVIQPINPDITSRVLHRYKTAINSNFSNYQPSLFRIDSTSIDVINNAVISMQINNLYEPFRQKCQLPVRRKQF
ncbi:MAG: hypothetical protein IPH69_15570 [Bacteroidales bacterium]|nr:hypothetical protein [Bacteroidales bacterium]